MDTKRLLIVSALWASVLGAEEPQKVVKPAEEGTSTTNVYDTKENVPDQTMPSRFYWDSYPYKKSTTEKLNTQPLDGNKHLFNEYNVPGEVPTPSTIMPEDVWPTPPPNDYYERYWKREEDDPHYKISPNNFDPTFFERESDQQRWDREREERERREREDDERRRREDEERRQWELQQRSGHS